MYYTAEAEVNENIISAYIPVEAYSYYFEFDTVMSGKRIVFTTALMYNHGKCREDAKVIEENQL